MWVRVPLLPPFQKEVDMLVDVTIQRIELKDHTFSIEAETLEDAEDKVGQQSFDYDWANSSVFM